MEGGLPPEYGTNLAISLESRTSSATSASFGQNMIGTAISSFACC